MTAQVPRPDAIARAAALRSLTPVAAGIPAVVVLTADPEQPGIVRVYAVVALFRRGLPVLAARAAVEEIVSRGVSVVLLPTVEDADVLACELDEAGLAAVFGGTCAKDGPAMLRRVRAAMDLPPDLPCLIDTSALALQ